MVSMQIVEGVVVLTLPEKYKEQALGIYNALVAQDTRALQNMTVKKYRTDYPSTTHGMSDQAAADMINELLLDKIEKAFGRRERIYLQRFYKSLEAISSRNLHKTHVERLQNAPHLKGHYPLRKIDTVIYVLGSQKVFERAKAFAYNSES